MNTIKKITIITNSDTSSKHLWDIEDEKTEIVRRTDYFKTNQEFYNDIPDMCERNGMRLMSNELIVEHRDGNVETVILPIDCPYQYKETA